MSTDLALAPAGRAGMPCTRRRRPEAAWSKSAAWCVVLAACLRPAAAANVTFAQEVQLDAGRDGNLAVVGEENLEDESAELSLALRLAGLGTRNNFELRYTPSVQVYRQFSEANNTAHALRFSLQHAASARSHVRFNLSANRSERQRLDFEQIGEPVSLVERTEIRAFALAVTAQHQATARATIAWAVGGKALRFEDSPARDFEDSEAADAEFGTARQLSPRTSLGWRYRFQNLSFEDRPSARVHALEFTGAWRPGRVWKVELALGAQTASARGNIGQRSDIDPSAQLILTFERSEASALSLGLRQTISSGTGLSAATRDRGGFLLWKGSTRRRRFAAEVAATHWRRDPLFVSDTGGTKGSRFSESALWNLGPHVSVGLYHQFVDQDRLAAAPEPLATRYHSWGTVVRWTSEGRQSHVGHR